MSLKMLCSFTPLSLFIPFNHTCWYRHQSLGGQNTEQQTSLQVSFRVIQHREDCCIHERSAFLAWMMTFVFKTFHRITRNGTLQTVKPSLAYMLLIKYFCKKKAEKYFELSLRKDTLVLVLLQYSFPVLINLSAHHFLLAQK